MVVLLSAPIESELGKQKGVAWVEGAHSFGVGFFLVLLSCNSWSLFEQYKSLDRRTITWILLITGLGAALRFAALGSVPVGLYQDEAFNGLDALRVLAGDHPIYFTTNNGREPLYIYLASLSIAWWGRTPAAVRLPAALLGTLTIPATALLGSTLFNRRTGLLSAVLVAITFWPIHLSRVAFRAGALPLFIALAIAAAWHGARARSRAWTLIGGLLYGLAFYTYLPVYVSPLVFMAFALVWWKKRVGTHLKFAAPYFLLGAFIALAPLIITMAIEPGILLGRTGQVSIIRQDGALSMVIKQLFQSLGMIFWRGDSIPRHNLPGRPILDPIMALFFLIGSIWLVINRRRPASSWIIMWSLLMMIPTIFAEDAPHFLRATGLLPFILIVPALGLERTWLWFSDRLPSRWIPVLLVISVLFASLALTIRDYFDRYAADPSTGYAFQSAVGDLVDQINREKGEVWVSERFAKEWESVPFLLENSNVNWLAADQIPRIGRRTAVLYLWPYGSIKSQVVNLSQSVRMTGWQGPLIKGDLEPDAYSLFWAYRLQPITADGNALAHFSNGISLDDAVVTPSSLSEKSDLVVQLFWSTADTLNVDYKVFVHVVDSTGLVAQHDGQPAEGTLPTGWWVAGNQIVDRHVISMPEPYEPERHRVIVGLYESATLDRLDIHDLAGKVVGDTVELP